MRERLDDKRSRGERGRLPSCRRHRAGRSTAAPRRNRFRRKCGLIVSRCGFRSVSHAVRSRGTRSTLARCLPAFCAALVIASSRPLGFPNRTRDSGRSPGYADFSRHPGRRTSVRRAGALGRLKSPVPGCRMNPAYPGGRGRRPGHCRCGPNDDRGLLRQVPK